MVTPAWQIHVLTTARVSSRARPTSVTVRRGLEDNTVTQVQKYVHYKAAAGLIIIDDDVLLQIKRPAVYKVIKWAATLKYFYFWYLVYLDGNSFVFIQ